jgi:23S rRNA (pseudouridine1915-N3)-methyltransferase
VQIHIVAATNRQPRWVAEACAEYAKRLRGHAALTLRDISLAKRQPNAASDRCRDDEARRMLAALPTRAHPIALDEGGALWSTVELAGRIEAWSRDGSKPCMLIGGPDGLGPAALAAAGEVWALSRLTLPHGLAKIVVLEALYRAFSVRAGHPSHRA